MIPLVGFQARSSISRSSSSIASPRKSSGEKKVKLNYLVGTMIEVPRGALTADEIAEDRRVLQLRHQRPDPDRAWA